MALTALGTGFSLMLKFVWSAISETRRRIDGLPEIYARRDDMHIIVETLRRIEDRLNRLSDKP